MTSPHYEKSSPPASTHFSTPASTTTDKKTVFDTAVRFLELHWHYDWYGQKAHDWIHTMPHTVRTTLINQLADAKYNPRPTDIELAEYLAGVEKTLHYTP